MLLAWWWQKWCIEVEHVTILCILITNMPAHLVCSIYLYFKIYTYIFNYYSENPNKTQQCINIVLFLILNEAQHVSGDTPPVIRSLKLYKQPLVLHMWKVVGRCPTTFHICKTRGCLCSFRLLMMGGVSPKTCWVSFKIRNNKNFDTLLHLVRFFTARQISIQIYHYFLPELIIFVPDVIGTNPLLAIALRYNASQHTENLRHKNILFLN